MDQSPNRTNSVAIAMAMAILIMGTLAITLYFGRPELLTQPTTNMKQIKVIKTTDVDKLEDLVNTAIKKLYAEKHINSIDNINLFHSTRTSGGSYTSTTVTTHTCIITYTE